MKKLICLLVCIMLALPLCSCRKEDAQNPNDTVASEISISSSEQVTTQEDDEEYEDIESIQKLYPNKTVLVWTYEQTMYPTPHTEEVNEYLDKLGCDFAVCFLPLESYVRGNGYSNAIRERIANGEQMDIIFSR